jgi:hypothetical protein
MEYYELEHYEFIRDKMLFLSELFHYTVTEIDYDSLYKTELDKSEKKNMKK